MIKRLFLIGILLSLVGLPSMQANAYPPRYLDMEGCWWCSPCITLTTEFVAISNPDIHPTDVYFWLSVAEGYAISVNPDGHPGGEGVPFMTEDLVLTGETTSGPDTPIRGSGRWEAEIQFDCDAIADQLALPALPNDNWSWIIVPTLAYVRLIANTDINGTCEGSSPPPEPEQCMDPIDPDPGAVYEEVIHVIAQLEPSFDGDGNVILGTTGTTTELFHWEYRNNHSELCEYEYSGDEYYCDYDFPFDAADPWWENTGTPVVP
jgi:hypothetical protein